MLPCITSDYVEQLAIGISHDKKPADEIQKAGNYHNFGHFLLYRFIVDGFQQAHSSTVNAT
ncbi:hypothetical protein ANSO36C_34120 [Nostoc cf. commune SO-36]|uniref:Uncharacterized protein n=1 Tax=Nostoc cf. commune SO-36 TaxID=449208 RepID=A0ABM7Z3N4_NOSCO|nr:hypothetical protein [Nostoc commune]BDI17610.1 hypothetical protein ANSO36C_34120 [Nostoc cf. commune SO-36]